MTRFEDFDCCLQFTWFNRATHPKHQSSNAVTPQSCLSPFPTLGELVACPPLPTGRGGSRVQAGGGLRSEGVARLPDVMEQAGLKGALCWQQSPRALPAPSAPHAGSSRQLRAAAALPNSVAWAFCLLFYFPFFFLPPFFFSPPFLPPKELGRREDGWS